MGRCTSCGAQLSDTAETCSVCGSPRRPVWDPPREPFDAAAPTPPAGTPRLSLPSPFERPARSGGERPQPAPPRHLARRRPRSSPTLVTVVVAVVVLASAAAAGFVLSRGSGSPGSAASGTPSSAAPGRGASPSTGAGAPAASFTRLYRQDVGGVVRVDAITCSGSGVGSGFLLGPNLVVTAAHVVDGAVAVGLTSGDTTRAGQVVGIDDAADVALIRTTAALPGHVFELAPSEAPVGADIGIIGYPEGGPVSFSQGAISGLDRSVDVQGQARDGLIQIDAAMNPGNSGGPLLAASGMVVGLADAVDTAAAGIGYAVPAVTAAPLLRRWAATPSPPAAASCSHPLGPSQAGPVQAGTSGPDVAGISLALTTYFDAIDGGDYASAYAQLGPSDQAQFSEQQFADEDATSYDYDIRVQSVTSEGRGTDLVDVSFTSLQSGTLGPNGDSCDNWTLQYTMVESNGAWLIDGATGQNGSTNTACPS